jgi:lactoylglutathione lyase
MTIEHIAIWTKDLENMKEFYQKFFHVDSNEKYTNVKKEFSSYFLSFESGARIELMHTPKISQVLSEFDANIGFAHFAISVGSIEKVIDLTEQIRNAGFKVVGEPRTTGDGYYESIIADPEGNVIEITE